MREQEHPCLDTLVLEGLCFSRICLLFQGMNEAEVTQIVYKELRNRKVGIPCSTVHVATCCLESFQADYKHCASLPWIILCTKAYYGSGAAEEVDSKSA